MSKLSPLAKVMISALLTLFALLQIQLWWGKGAVTELYQLHIEIEKQKHENALLSQRNQYMSSEIADLRKGTDGIEEIARSKLGMIRKGESFFLFVEPEH